MKDITEYPSENFFNLYFAYLDYPTNTEASLTCHRWCAISMLGTLLGRQFYLPFGATELIPNHYIQIVGLPAARKSTAIKAAIRVMAQFGYSDFSPKKTSIFQFLTALHNKTWGKEDPNDKEFNLDRSVWGTDEPAIVAESMEIAHMYIAVDEFITFIGRSNLDFIALLGDFWDIDKVHSETYKSSAVHINKPTINILAGNTHEGFHNAFPPEIRGEGFFSRLLLIHAKGTGRKKTVPDAPTLAATNAMLNYMNRIKNEVIGRAVMTPEAYAIVDKSYHTWKDLEDSRFDSYSGRRFTYLLKLCLIMSAARCSKEIHSCDALMANTLLTFAEYNMPSAIGQFGKGKNSEIAHKILSAISSSASKGKIMTIVELYKLLHSEVNKLTDINAMMMELLHTGKIQSVKTDTLDGFLPVKHKVQMHDSELLRPSWLYEEEKI